MNHIAGHNQDHWLVSCGEQPALYRIVCGSERFLLSIVADAV